MLYLNLMFDQVDKKLAGIRKFNLFMGFLHLVQAAAMYFLSNDFSIPITTSYLKATGTGFPTPQTEVWFNLRVGPWVALFLLLSALAHFLLASPLLNKWYNENLKKNINHARWYEYAISSSVMIVVIAGLSGIYDFSLLLALFGLNACMNLFGLVMELHNQATQKTNWTSFVYGCIAGIIPWIIVALAFYNALADASGNVPSFVYFILISLFITFNIFPINMILQYKKVGLWKDYLFGEKVYIVLSLVAKSLLAWQVFSGTLRPM